MKTNLLILGAIILTIAVISCNQNSEKPTSTSQEKSEKKEADKTTEAEMTVELYCKVNNELKALLMEKYWDKFKDKTYEEAKDDYAQYIKDEQAICEKHGIIDQLDLSNFFRGNFSEIEKFQDNNPDYKDYPEYQDAKEKVVSFAFSNI
ncbi:MAG: hypothetical protein PHE33_08690 [Bacteroidales bacterium]|nr:hypothetical protein [Bacteroidales bacterium]